MEANTNGIRHITRDEGSFPERLLGIPGSPSELWLIGSLPPAGTRAVAIVGARRATSHGKWMAEKLAADLAAEGICIISGMAEGIDGASHLGALGAGGYTLAVLGTGVDVCYPRINLGLYRRISETGGIISEYPPGSGAQSFSFPARNRIISGLSDLVIVVEARERSGSLITVSHALAQGRDVMAVPGRPDDPCSAACNRLIREGAGCCTCARDVLEYLEVLPPRVPPRRMRAGAGAAGGKTTAPQGAKAGTAADAGSDAAVSPAGAAAEGAVPSAKASGAEPAALEPYTLKEALILSHLTHEPCHIDTLAARCGMDVTELTVRLVEMELKGYVTAVTPGLYRSN